MACKLCLRDVPLRGSHIIPAFVFRWLRESSPTGHMRTSQTPNKRVQDGPTVPMLCDDCEGHFAAWEKEFAERVFMPLHQGAPEPFVYDEWGLKFAISISWRSLMWPQDGRWNHLSTEQQSAAGRAAEMWRQFLLGEPSHPGDYEQRWLPLDVMESHSAPDISPFMNRYMTRVVVADIIRGTRTVMTYSKLCRVLVLGFIDVPERRKWVGGKVHVKGGSFGGPIRYEVPEGFFDYMNSSANAAGAALGRMSDKQSDKLTAHMLKDPESVAKSEVFRAMRKDVELSGNKAFDLKALNEDVE